MPMLRVSNLTHYFGGLRALYQYNLSIEPGEIRGLIGPNGSGKATVFNLITGIHTPTEGPWNWTAAACSACRLTE